MPKKLSSPSSHGSRSEVLFARKISPVNKNDFVPSASRPSVSKARMARTSQRFSTWAEGKNPEQWTAQEKFRSGGWNSQELTVMSKNYADAARYHLDKGSYDKANHYQTLSNAAKQESTTAKRVATTAKNKADRAARVKVASDRFAAKKLAKSKKG